ncbi:MAG: winged helix-turn-helix domain-containing protein [Erythrobacter sp.]
MKWGFEDFTLDSEAFELRKGDEPLQAEPQVLSLLILLVENQGKLLKKDDIIDAIWDGRAISDAALSSRVKSVRQLLGDSGREQRLIKTIYGNGLRFVGHAEIAVSSAPEESVNEGSSRIQEARLDPSTSLPDLSGKPSIGVLPFKAIASDPESGFIASGLTEDITANLARFRGLIVISRTTTSAVSDRQSIVSDLHEQFGVDLVLQGSLQRNGNRLRVRAQLIDARTEAHLISEQFDRPYVPESQFDIQDEIASLVAARIGDLYGPTGDIVKRLQPDKRPKSWATVVWLARFHDYYTLRDPALHAEITKGLENALESDPNSSSGWAALSRLRIEEYRLPFHFPPKLSLRDEALEYARKSVQLDGNNDMALTSLALSHFLAYEVDEFEATAKRALEVNPNNAITLAEIAMCYCLMSDFERAIPLARRAIELSPVHPGWFCMPIACGMFMQGDARAALHEQLKTPVVGYFWYHAHLAAYYAELGQMEKARAEVEATREIHPHFEERIHTEGFVLSVGKPFFDRMAKGWRKAGFKIPSEAYESGYAGIAN